MNIIDQYEADLIDYDYLQSIIWGCGRQLINEVGLDKFIFYLNAEDGEYYEKE